MRDSFIFYRSFCDAIRTLPKRDQSAIFLAICDYALDGKEPELAGVQAALFALMRPVLEANRKRYENGAKPKQSRSKTEAKEKQNRSKTEANKDKDKDKYKDKDVYVDEDKDSIDLTHDIDDMDFWGEFLKDES